MGPDLSSDVANCCVCACRCSEWNRFLLVPVNSSVIFGVSKRGAGTCTSFVVCGASSSVAFLASFTRTVVFEDIGTSHSTLPSYPRSLFSRIPFAKLKGPFIHPLRIDYRKVSYFLQRSIPFDPGTLGWQTIRSGNEGKLGKGNIWDLDLMIV